MANFDRSLVEAKVIYKDVDDQDRPVNRATIKGTAGSQINPEQYRDQIPQGYEFSSYGNFDQRLISGHANVIYVKEKSSDHKALREGVIKVDYVDNHNQLIGRHSFVGQSGEDFQVREHRDTIPQQYRFNKILVGKNVTKFTSDTQMVVIALNKMRVHSKINVLYICDGHRVGHASSQDLEGNYFDPDPFKYRVPAHYHFVKMVDPIPRTFKSHDVTIRFQVKPDRPKPANKSVRQQNSQQIIKNNQDLGSILLKIGSSLNSLGKIIQDQNKSKR